MDRAAPRDAPRAAPRDAAGLAGSLSSLATLARRVMDRAAPRDAPRDAPWAMAGGPRRSSDRYPGAPGGFQKGSAVAVTDIQGPLGDVSRDPP
eukprot:gene20145-biopygen22088